MLELGRHFIAGDIGRLPAESGSYRRPTPEPKDGEFLVRITHLSFDPTQRGWISRDSYVPAVPLGAVVRAAGAGRVVRSRHPDFREGELVQGSFGWQDYIVTNGTTDIMSDNNDQRRAQIARHRSSQAANR
jgi:NADPH-dependent curcumin reductase CurA